MSENIVARHLHFTTLQAQPLLLRHEKLDGIEYLVAPVVPVVEGVHNGEFVPYKEISVFPDSWDGIPLPVDHPKDDNGDPITANSPKIIQSSVIGRLFNVVARKDLRGISGEVWIDIAKANTVPGGDEVLRKLNAGEVLEVSTAYNVFVVKDPGEFTNPVTGEVEKYTHVQQGMRPDHLAMLPYDTGACSWQDGCGAGRLNKDKSTPIVSSDHAVASKDMAEQTIDKTALKLRVNGKQLGNALKAALIAHNGTDGTPAEMVGRLAAAAGITTEKVTSLCNGELDFAPKSWMTIFAAVLDIDPYDLFLAASNDNSSVRWSENEQDSSIKHENVERKNTIKDGRKSEVEENNSQPTEQPVTRVDNASMSTATTDSSHQHPEGKTCNSCAKKTLRTQVTDILKSLFMGTEGDSTEMTKKERIEALIASDKNKFSANNKEWLESLTEEQLALLEPEVAAKDEKPATATPAAAAAANAEVKPAEVKPAPAANAQATTETPANDEKPAVVQLSAEQIYAVMGVTAEDIKNVKAINDQKKADRAALVAKVAALSNCPYEKTELEGMSDAILQKTFNALQPVDSPFYAAPMQRQQADWNTVPAAPSIVLGPVQKEGK